MPRTTLRRNELPGVLGALLVVALGSVWAAQPTGLVRGRVTDPEGRPVEAATVRITASAEENVNREFRLQTDANGAYTQIGLPPGMYHVTAEKPGIGTGSHDVRIHLGQTADVNIQLQVPSDLPGAGAIGMTDVDMAAVESLKAAFDAGVALSEAGKPEEAIAKFREGIAALADCYQCYYNIGVIRANQKQYAEAEEAYRKTIEIKPDYAEAYTGLANLYNALRRFEEAAAASAEAAKHSTGVAAALAGTNAAVPLLNQGIILWNAGKTLEAKAQFEQALAADPEFADAHYWMGLAHLNQGELDDAVASLERYLDLAPQGDHAGEAKGVLDQIRP